MRHALAVDGVPVGYVELSGAVRASGVLEALPDFQPSHLRQTARRLGAALYAIPAPHAAALASALAEELDWQTRLSLIDARGATAQVARITVVEFPDGDVIVVADLGIQPAAIGARLPPRITRGGGEQSRPAA